VIGYLLVTQFVRGALWNDVNNFGWRAVLVPVLLLSLWGAVGLAWLTAGAAPWPPDSGLGRRRRGLMTVVAVAVTIGLLSTALLWHVPAPRRHPPPPEILALRKGFLRQHHAWSLVREHAAPAERVQANPDGYAALTPWPAMLPFALFADRATAYASVEYSTVFALRHDPAQNRRQYERVREVFSARPAAEAIRELRDRLGVKVLLVDRFDPVWPSTAIEDSGLYAVVHREADFKIYRAR
jgi:hypothetical protein